MTDTVERSLRKLGITVSRPVLGVIAIVFGVLFFIFPQLVSYLIGIFLIIEGVLLLVDYLELRNQHRTITSSSPPPTPSPSPTPSPRAPPSPTEAKPLKDEA